MQSTNEQVDVSLLSVELTDISDELKQISDESSQVNILSNRARDSAEQGEQALSNVRTTLDAFVDSTSQINQFLEEINLLTQQVHILGVNAAIEAASAGEHSGGFSIIAEEMRRIAAMVKQTSANIFSVLENTGTLADNTVNAIQAASETLELLGVSADLSIELSKSISKVAQSRSRCLELHIPSASSESQEDTEAPERGSQTDF
jgi:methyl-accepting chemotaxis protein